MVTNPRKDRCDDCPEPTNLQLLEAIQRAEDRVNRRIDSLERHFTGGSEPSRGLIVRIDRIEQARNNQRWLTHTALAVAIGAMVTAALAKLGFKWPQ